MSALTKRTLCFGAAAARQWLPAWIAADAGAEAPKIRIVSPMSKLQIRNASLPNLLTGDADWQPEREDFMTKE
jgi:hypothetical protein